MNFLKVEHNLLLLDFGVFDFKTRECLIEIPGYYNLDQDYWRKGCHTLATVKTSDNKYVMVELSGKSMNNNVIDFLGGIMEVEPPIKNGKDLFLSLYKELEEEAFITADDIRESYLKLVYINSKTNVGFYFEIFLKISSQDLQERFDSHRKELDIRALKIMSQLEYVDVLKNHNENKQFIATQIEI